MNRLLLIAVIVPATGCPAAKQSVPAANVTVTPQVTVEKAPDPVKWARLGESVTIGETKVTLSSVSVGKYRVRSYVEEGEERDSDDIAIVARVRIDNLRATRNLKYTTWQGVKGVSLVDERGTDYFVIGVYKLGWEVVGSVRSFADAEPGASLEDVLRFKPPLAGATTFRLTLPDQRGGDLTGPVPFRFEFTRDDLKK